MKISKFFPLKKISWQQFHKIAALSLVLIIAAEAMVLAEPTIGLSFSKLKSSAPANPAPGLQTAELAEFRAYWSEQLKNYPAKEVYQNFVEGINRDGLGEQHGLAHHFGELLYSILGLDGIAVCDYSFNYGCPHGFLGAAISREGAEIVAELDRICMEKLGEAGQGCQHGFGHGLLSYFGYDSLLEALQACSAVPWINPLEGGCTGGVFMEYNFQGNVVPVGSTRKLDPRDPYSPCSTLPDKFLSSCYLEQPQWWGSVLERDYAKMGSLCSSIEESKYRDKCFRGIGKATTSFVSHNVERTIEICHKMPTSHGFSVCLAEASWAFYNGHPYRNIASSICNPLSTEERGSAGCAPKET